MAEVTEIKFPRMRTIEQTAILIKELDPETEVTEYYIRQLVNENKIVYRKAGRKALINIDKFIDYLSSSANAGELESNKFNLQAVN